MIGSRGEVTINPRELMGRRGFDLARSRSGPLQRPEEADIQSPGLFAGPENGTLRPIVGKKLLLADAVRAPKEILEPERRQDRTHRLIR